MSSAWAVRLPASAAPAAAGLRLEPGIEVLETADTIWLRVSSADERLQRLLLKLPGALRFEMLPGGELRPAESRLPSGRLPAGVWTKIKAWAQVELPPAAFAARMGAKIPLRLVRVTGDTEANVLHTALSVWTAYGSTAPQIRLQKLRFAVSAEERVVIHGSPLPPLPGQRYCERSGVAVPCGWGWLPAVEPELLRDAWRLEPQDLALVSTDGSWQYLHSEHFVHATRSAIRETAAD